VHAVFWLAATMVLAAVVFVALDAPFLAGIQLVLYTGGVITLMLFGVMLTHRDPESHIPNPIASTGRAAVTAGGMLVVLLSAIWTTDLSGFTARPTVTATEVGRRLMLDHLIAFEALSVLLLAAMVGAIVLARKVDP
jgi:NADH-quinone oxidoreductase subunit J